MYVQKEMAKQIKKNGNVIYPSEAHIITFIFIISSKDYLDS